MVIFNSYVKLPEGISFSVHLRSLPANDVLCPIPKGTLAQVDKYLFFGGFQPARLLFEVVFPCLYMSYPEYILSSYLHTTNLWLNQQSNHELSQDYDRLTQINPLIVSNASILFHQWFKLGISSQPLPVIRGAQRSKRVGGECQRAGG